MRSRIWAGHGRLPAMVAALACISACRWFELSPYAVPERDRGQEWHALTMSEVSRTDGTGRAFSFAVIADVQSAYDELQDAVGRINADSSIRFVIVGGDITQQGLQREFEWVKRSMDDLHTPYLPVIGNHDCLANGVDAFRRLFGPLDYSFTYRGTRFVLFNSNDWEFEGTVPDTAWLESELESAPDSLRLVTVSHIPPWGDQLAGRIGDGLMDLFARRGVDLSIHGHQHNYHFERHDGGGKVPYVLADNVEDRNFVKITLLDSGLSVERIHF